VSTPANLPAFRPDPLHKARVRRLTEEARRLGVKPEQASLQPDPVVRPGRPMNRTKRRAIVAQTLSREGRKLHSRMRELARGSKERNEVRAAFYGVALAAAKAAVAHGKAGAEEIRERLERLV
jgi:hypothetical protein